MTEFFITPLPPETTGEELQQFLYGNRLPFLASSKIDKITSFVNDFDESTAIRSTKGFAPEHTAVAVQPDAFDNDTEFICRVCNAIFFSYDLMVAHWNAHPKCNICGIRLGTGEAVKEHQRGHLDCDVCGISFNDTVLTTELMNHRTSHPRCTFCNQRYSTRQTLDNHIRNDHAVCDVCGKSFHYASIMKGHRRSHTGEKFDCELCHKQFNWKYNLMVHMRTHTGEKFGVKVTSPQVSDVVGGYDFTSNFSVLQPEPRPLNDAVLLTEKYASGGASIMLSSGTAILNHVVKEEREHANPLLSEALVKEEIEEDYPFFVKNPLYTLGTPAEALVMDEEADEFGRRDSGAIEMTKLEGAPPGIDDPSICNICKATFTSFSELIGHLHSHAGKNYFPCSVCGKFLSSSESLRIHKLIHTEDFPYRCDVCHKRFRQDAQRRQHMRIHTGEHFKCPECLNTYPHLSSLSQHRHRVHGIPRGPRGRPRRVKE